MRSSLGQEIKSIRKEMGLTQKQLAKKAGVSEITIRKYEAESVPLKNDTLSKIAIALGLNEYYFYGFATKKEAEIFQAIEGNDIKKLEEVLALPNGSVLKISNLHDNDVVKKAFRPSLGVDELALLDSYGKLNAIGKEIALVRVQELTEIPRYQKDNEEKE